MRSTGLRRTWRLTAAAAVGGALALAGDIGTASATTSPTTDCAGTICTVTYTYTGGLQSWSVPAGVSSANFDVFGAAGGADASATGGLGGETKGTLSLTPGELVFVFVGGEGTAASSAGTSTGPTAGGFNGGGDGGGPTSGTGDSGASGGGASDVRVGGAAASDRVIVAGGGGGAASAGGSTGKGGAGGASTGGAGSGEAAIDGAGGTQSAGGAAGAAVGSSGVAGTAGVLADGGAGGGLQSGGGGGGYYGGGGGGYDSGTSAYGPGGGGSSYAATSVGGTVLNAGVQSANGEVIITYVDDDLSIGGVPSDISTTATGSSGAVVDYSAPVALDPFLATLPTVNCSPASGTTFAVGTTTVDCSATDADGVTSTASFTVTVSTASAESTVVPGATDVTTGEPWAGARPFEAAVAALGLGLVGAGLARRRRARARVASGGAA